MSDDDFGCWDGDYGDFDFHEWDIQGNPCIWTSEERVLLNLPTIPPVDDLASFGTLSLNEEKESPVDISDEDDSDSESEIFLEAFLRFREAFLGSKQQLKAMTLERFQNLLQEAQNIAAHSMMGLDYEPHLQLTTAHLNAFRASQTPGFPSSFFPPSTSPQKSGICEAVTVELLSNASAPVPALLPSSPCPPVALETVTVKRPLFLPHASATLATVPASITSPPPLSVLKTSSGRRRRRHQGKSSHAR